MVHAIAVMTWFCGVAACSPSIGAAQSAAQPDAAVSLKLPKRDSQLARLVDEAVDDLRSDRNESDARATLDAIVDGPAAQRLDATRRRDALSWAAWGAMEADEFARAHDLIRRATELDTATQGNWTLRGIYALMADDAADALVAFTHVAEEWPEHMMTVPSSYVHEASATTDPMHHDAKLRFLSVLFENKWRLPYREQPSELWRRLALLRLERGELNIARDVAGRIADPEVLVRARADKRFDSLIAASPELFDVAAAAARDVARLEQEVRAAPDKLELMTLLSGALQRGNRCEDALRVVEEAMMPSRQYSDIAGYAAWALDYRARALECLGRWDEAVRRRADAATVPVNGRPNTSQVINLAHLYVAVGRPGAALEALALVGPTSEFGKMQEQWARLQAHRQLGEAAGVQAAMAYLTEHRDDAPAEYLAALLLVGETEAAAALLIQRLESPGSRANVLQSVQLYAESPMTPYESERKVRAEALLARDDVRAAIERVGRIESYPFLRNPGIDE